MQKENQTASRNLLKSLDKALEIDLLRDSESHNEEDPTLLKSVVSNRWSSDTPSNEDMFVESDTVINVTLELILKRKRSLSPISLVLQHCFLDSRIPSKSNYFAKLFYYLAAKLLYK